MGRIVAISSGHLEDTRALNEYGIKLSGKLDPHVLFVGTASGDAEGYIANVTAHYGLLGCQVMDLSLTKRVYSEAEIDELLGWADIIYVGGGDTLAMMECWRECGLDQKLKQVFEHDQAVLTGMSAGAMCWFLQGFSDSIPDEKGGKCFGFAEGMLGMIPYVLCPHYEEAERKCFDQMMADRELPGLAMESDVACVMDGESIFLIRCREEAKAYLINWEKGVMHKESEQVCHDCERMGY